MTDAPFTEEQMRAAVDYFLTCEKCQHHPIEVIWQDKHCQMAWCPECGWDHQAHRHTARKPVPYTDAEE